MRPGRRPFDRRLAGAPGAHGGKIPGLSKEALLPRRRRLRCPGLCGCPEDKGILYAMRIKAEGGPYESIERLVTGTVGRPAAKPKVFYTASLAGRDPGSGPGGWSPRWNGVRTGSSPAGLHRHRPARQDGKGGEVLQPARRAWEPWQEGRVRPGVGPLLLPSLCLQAGEAGPFRAGIQTGKPPAASRPPGRDVPAVSQRHAAQADRDRGEDRESCPQGGLADGGGDRDRGDLRRGPGPHQVPGPSTRLGRRKTKRSAYGTSRWRSRLSRYGAGGRFHTVSGESVARRGGSRFGAGFDLSVGRVGSWHGKAQTGNTRSSSAV